MEHLMEKRNESIKESVNSKDVDEMLKLAEKLKVDYEKRSNIIVQSRIFELVVALSLILFYFFNFTHLAGDKILFSPLGPISVMNILFLLIFVFFFEIQVWRIQKNKNQLKRSINAAVETLREIGELISKEEKWSYLKKMEFRIRISQFDIHSENTFTLIR